MNHIKTLLPHCTTYLTTEQKTKTFTSTRFYTWLRRRHIRPSLTAEEFFEATNGCLAMIGTAFVPLPDKITSKFLANMKVLEKKKRIKRIKQLHKLELQLDRDRSLVSTALPVVDPMCHSYQLRSGGGAVLMATDVTPAAYHKDVSSGTQDGSIQDPIILTSEYGSGSSGDDADGESRIEEEEEEEEEEDSEGCMSVIEDESEE
ncbi:hypothetical protein MVEG_08895 [Podila verticillata NRRL 6337]|nr:hypothetical protein MVEG_08895 [Podila verticillata NRRL 6337]